MAKYLKYTGATFIEGYAKELSFEEFEKRHGNYLQRYGHDLKQVFKELGGTLKPKKEPKKEEGNGVG